MSIPEVVLAKTVELPEGTKRVGVANIEGNMLGIIAVIPGHAPMVWHPGQKQWYEFQVDTGEVKGLIVPNGRLN